jgi:hypothetical protein
MLRTERYARRNYRGHRNDAHDNRDRSSSFHQTSPCPYLRIFCTKGDTKDRQSGPVLAFATHGRIIHPLSTENGFEIRLS